MLIYDSVFCVLALVAIYIAFCDLTSGCTDVQIMVDNIITTIFVVDYIVRLLVSDHKKAFIKNNVLDLIAIIPFTSLFKVFRVFKMFKILKALKFLKFARFSAYFARFYISWRHCYPLCRRHVFLRWNLVELCHGHDSRLW